MAQQGLYITVYALLFVCVMCLLATDKDYLTLSLSQQIIFSGMSRRLPCMLCQGSPLSPVIKGVWALLCYCSLINVNHCRLPLGLTSVLHLYSKNLCKSHSKVRMREGLDVSQQVGLFYH